MNKDNRKELDQAITLIEAAKEIIDRIRDEEQDKFDNLSEGLQQSEKGQKFEETVSTLDDVSSQLDDAIDGINMASE